jgi:hypothetical protein
MLEKGSGACFWEMSGGGTVACAGRRVGIVFNVYFGLLL